MSTLCTVFLFVQVRLFLQSVQGVCYSGVPGQNSDFLEVEVAPNDASSVYFPIVPLEIGKFPVRVVAFSSWGRDAVEKVLKVEASIHACHNDAFERGSYAPFLTLRIIGRYCC